MASTSPATLNTKSRGWCVTVNNYTEEDLVHIRKIDCQYKIIGKETAPTTGTPHLQCYFYWANARSYNMVKTLFREWHLEKAKGNSFQNYEYCSKEGDFEEQGPRPKDPRKGGGDAQLARWQGAVASAEAGNMEDIPADLLVRYHNTWKRMRMDAQLSGVHEETSEQMEWYWGPSGTGKSRFARDNNPGCYLKMCNKWWDAYKGEDVVLLEDLDRDHSKLVHFLKIWADRYPFPAEVKGAAIMIRPKKIIVTSNYHPNEIWDRAGDLEPILRRFKCIEFKPQLGAAGGAAAKKDVVGHLEADCETFNRPTEKSCSSSSADY